MEVEVEIVKKVFESIKINQAGIERLVLKGLSFDPNTTRYEITWDGLSAEIKLLNPIVETEYERMESIPVRISCETGCKNYGSCNRIAFGMSIDDGLDKNNPSFNPWDCLALVLRK